MSFQDRFGQWPVLSHAWEVVYLASPFSPRFLETSFLCMLARGESLLRSLTPEARKPQRMFVMFRSQLRLAVVPARRVLTTVAMAAVAATTALSAWAGPPASAYIYGIDNNNDIYEIDPVAKTSTLALVQPAGGFSNSLAFDTNRNHLFFVGPDNGLKYWVQGSGSAGLSVGGSPAVGTDPNNAAYYNNAYWFFDFNSNVLNRWNLGYSGTGASGVPSVTSTQTYLIASMFLPASGTTGLNTNTFGDIAINASTGILYASTTRGRFYSLDLTSDPTNTFTELAAGLGLSNTLGLQLSFNTDYSTLYGHSYEDGTWYTVAAADGARTLITDFSTTPFGGKGFRDLGGAAVTAVPEPSSIVLTCVGAGGLAWRYLRRRRSAA